MYTTCFFVKTYGGYTVAIPIHQDIYQWFYPDIITIVPPIHSLTLKIVTCLVETRLQTPTCGSVYVNVLWGIVVDKLVNVKSLYKCYLYSPQNIWVCRVLCNVYPTFIADIFLPMWFGTSVWQLWEIIKVGTVHVPVWGNQPRGYGGTSWWPQESWSRWSKRKGIGRWIWHSMGVPEGQSV